MIRHWILHSIQDITPAFRTSSHVSGFSLSLERNLMSPQYITNADAKLQVGDISDMSTVEASADTLQDEKSDVHTPYGQSSFLICLAIEKKQEIPQFSATDPQCRALRYARSNSNANRHGRRETGL